MTTYHLRGTDGTEVFTGTIQPPPGGGSVPGAVKFASAIVVNATDLLTGRATIYTPDAGYLIEGVRYGDTATFLDAQYIVFETPTSQFAGSSYATASFGASGTTLDSIGSAGQGFSNLNGDDGGYLQSLKAGPLTATLAVTGNGGSNFARVLATPGWQSAHVYGVAVAIIEAGHLWTNDGGTSGGSKPDFAGNTGGSVTDNGMTWTDRGNVPTQGTVTIYVAVTKP